MPSYTLGHSVPDRGLTPKAQKSNGVDATELDCMPQRRRVGDRKRQRVRLNIRVITVLCSLTMESRSSKSLVSFALAVLILLSIGSATVASGPVDRGATPGTKPTVTSLVGGEAWLSNSIPFSLYAANSTILALPSVSSWLSSHSISIYDLKPYLSMWPSSGNPYDYSQGSVSFVNNQTVYDVYTYILPNGTVVGVWVMSGNPAVVGRPYTFPSQSGGNYLSGDTHEEKTINGVGHLVEDTNAFNNNKDMQGAEMNTTVFNDLSNPSTCGTHCWAWVDWLGVSNYLWIGSLPSDAFFFQVELTYWGGNIGEPSNCGSNSYSSDCVFFQYVLDNGSLMTYTPNVGGWSLGSAVTFEWPSPTANCTPEGGVSGAEDWVVVLKVTDHATGQSASYDECFPTNPYAEFLEERPEVNGVLGNEPEFGTHDFSASLINDLGSKIALNSGSATWQINMWNSQETSELVSTTVLSNGATSSTWSDSWIAS